MPKSPFEVLQLQSGASKAEVRAKFISLKRYINSQIDK